MTPASDVYSFAILMYELYTCKHLFKGLLHSQVRPALLSPSVSRSPQLSLAFAPSDLTYSVPFLTGTSCNAGAFSHSDDADPLKRWNAHCCRGGC